jgi:uncharacterized protein Yka (UPF0111/DUF47 family)
VEGDGVKRRWLLRDRPDLLGLLREQAAITLDGMRAFTRWVEGHAAAGDEVRAIEHRADAKKHELWLGLREAFTTPIDAEDLYALSVGVDGLLNGAKDLVRESEVLAMLPDAASVAMAATLQVGVERLVEAVAALATRDTDPTEPADAAVKSQRQLEHAYRDAMASLLDVADLREVMGRRELYRRFARIGIALEEVAERVWYAVVKES